MRVFSGVMVALSVLAGCVFHDKAGEYRCPCDEGLVCQNGICVATPDQLDGAVGDAAPTDGPARDTGGGDAARDTAQRDGSPQDDAQHDAPPQQDAAPGCVFDPLTSDEGNFQAVLTSMSWRFTASGYEQQAADDLHDSWIDGPAADAVSISATVTVTTTGKDDFPSLPGNYSIAGVVARASGLTATSATGYFCGLEARAGRLLLGRMSGAYSVGNGTFTIIAQQQVSAPVGTPLPVHLQVQGTNLTCSSGSTQVTATDAQIPQGSVGLFTIGATARFQDAMWCIP